MATLLVQSSPSPPRSPTWGEARERLLSSDQGLPDFNLNKKIYPDVKGLSGEPLNIINALREPFSRLPEVWYLYDDKGSILFEEITKQPEYYVAHKVSFKKRRLNGECCFIKCRSTVVIYPKQFEMPFLLIYLIFVTTLFRF